MPDHVKSLPYHTTRIGIGVQRLKVVHEKTNLKDRYLHYLATDHYDRIHRNTMYSSGMGIPELPMTKVG